MEAVNTAPSGFFFTDEGTGQSYPIADGSILGRAHGEIRFPLDIRMSSKHAKVMVINGDVYLEDLNSRNGVVINGKKIEAGKAVRIFPGDIVVLGTSTLCLGRYSAPSAPKFEDDATAVIARPKPKPVVVTSLKMPSDTPAKADSEDELASGSDFNLFAPPVEDTPTPTPIITHRPTAPAPAVPPQALPPQAPPPKLVAQLAKEKAEVEAGIHARYIPDDESNYPEIRIFLVLMALGFGALMITSGGGIQPSTIDLIKWGSNYAPKTTHGEWWRLFSSAFVHSSFLHLFINMLLVWKAGRVISEFLGTITFLCVALATHILTSLLAVSLQHDVAFVGAHASAIGLFSAAFLLSLRNSDANEATDRGVLVFGFLILLAAHAQSGPQTAKDIALFVASALAGALFSVLCAPPQGFNGAPWWMRYARPTLVIAIVSAAFYLAIPFVPRAPDNSEKLAQLIQSVLPLAKGHDHLRAQQKKGEVTTAQVVSQIQNIQLPKLRAFEKDLIALEPFVDKRSEAVNELKLTSRAWIEAWELHLEALVANDKAIAARAFEREKQGFAALEKANHTFLTWKRSSHSETAP